MRQIKRARGAAFEHDLAKPHLPAALSLPVLLETETDGRISSVRSKHERAGCFLAAPRAGQDTSRRLRSGQPDPVLLAIPRDNLDRWMRAGGRSMPYLERWKQLVDGPFDDLLRLIQEEWPLMTELRQSTPFAGVPEPKEWWRILEPLE